MMDKKKEFMVKIMSLFVILKELKKNILIWLDTLNDND